MGNPVPISFGTGSNKTRYGLEGLPEFVNAYIEDLGDGSKTGFSAYAIAGSELFADLGIDGEIRAMLPFDDQLLVVAGRSLFSVPLSGEDAILVGGIPADGFVTMERNRRTSTQAVIVCNGLWWYYEAGVLTDGTDADLSPPIANIQHHGYFIFLHANGKWSISGIDDITVSGLDFTEASSNADGLVMGAVRGPDVIMFGERSADVYQDTGGPDFPYTLSTALDVGCYCAGSVRPVSVQRNRQLVESVIWTATDRDGAYAGIYMLDSFTPIKISTDEVDRLVAGEANKQNIRAMSWTEDAATPGTNSVTTGKAAVHSFYTISGSNWTRTFDARTGYWGKRKSAGLPRWRYGTHAYFGGKHIFGHYATGKLYASRPDLLTEAGDDIDWEITTPTVHASPHPIRVNALHVGALTGVGLASGDDADTDPILLLDYSKDGGASFAAARRCHLGKAAQRAVRIKERAFGKMDKNGMAIRVRCSAAVMRGLQELAIDFDKLAA